MTSRYDLFSAYNDASVVCVTDEMSVSAGALRARVGELAAMIVETAPGFRDGDSVLVACADRISMLEACLAVWSLRGIVVLAPNRARETLLDLYAQGAARCLLVDETALEGEFAAGPRSTIPIKNIQTAGATSPHAACCDLVIDADRVVARVYTSGSTGRHQCCSKTARQLFGEAKLLAATFGFSGAALVGATVPAHHLYGLLFSLLMPLAAGARIAGQLRLSADGAGEHTPITDLITVPTHARALLEDGRIRQLSGVRTFSSGGYLDADVAKRFHAVTEADVIDVLGSSESGGIGYRLAHKESLYQPLPGIDVRCGPDGALLLRSPFLEDDGATFHPMADRVELASKGRFRHLGRTDGVVKIGGKRVAIQELKTRALALPGTTDAAVYVHQSSRLRGLELWLAVASTEPGCTALTLREALAKHFDQVLLPRRYRILKQLPRNALGKLSQAALRALFEAASPKVKLGPPALVDANQYAVDVFVPQGLAHFKGHFEGVPILAGIAQLTEVVIPACKLTYGELGALRRISRLKFCQTVAPETRMTLLLRKLLPASELNRSYTAVRFELLRHSCDGDGKPERDSRHRVTLGELRFGSAGGGPPTTNAASSQ